MKFLLAPDSFKGTMSSLQVIRMLRQKAEEHFSPVDIVELPIADGGEGTVDALVAATGGERRKVMVTGPNGVPVLAEYGIIDGKTAVIEMAQASGLTLVPAGERDPLKATTLGTGEIICRALEAGIRDFIIGIGGSATNDGGIGAAQAAGVRFLDANGKDVGFGGGALGKISSIDLDGMHPAVRESKFTVICDVCNTLTGKCGATAVFGPQKGVTESTFATLESGMRHYGGLLQTITGKDIASIPGAGAAGGLGAGLIAFFGASLRPGIETMLDIVGFDGLIRDVDLVVTGEGRIDGQSIYGKVPVGIARRCMKTGVPVAAVVGSIANDMGRVYACGVDSIMSTFYGAITLEEAMANAEEMLLSAADRMFRFIKIGFCIGKKK